MSPVGLITLQSIGRELFYFFLKGQGDGSLGAGALTSSGSPTLSFSAGPAFASKVSTATMPSSILGPLLVALVALAGLTVLGTIHEIPEGYAEVGISAPL